MSRFNIESIRVLFAGQGLEVISYVGGGAFGDVFKVRDTSGQFFALKLLSPSGADLGRFKREAMGMQKIDSPFVAKLHRWSLGDSEIIHPYLLTSFIEGETLRKIQGRGVLWTPQECITNLDYLLQGLSAFAAVGNGGAIHRDIKPSNIIIRASDSVPVIVDLGFVRVMDMSSLTPTDYGLIGTPQYAPPELWTDPKRADLSTDMFSLGIVAYEMVSGRHPYFDGSESNLYEAKEKMCFGSPVHLQDVKPEISAELSQFIMFMIRKEKSKRLRSADYALERLRTLKI